MIFFNFSDYNRIPSYFNMIFFFLKDNNIYKNIYNTLYQRKTKGRQYDFKILQNLKYIKTANKHFLKS